MSSFCVIFKRRFVWFSKEGFLCDFQKRWLLKCLKLGTLSSSASGIHRHPKRYNVRKVSYHHMIYDDIWWFISSSTEFAHIILCRLGCDIIDDRHKYPISQQRLSTSEQYRENYQKKLFTSEQYQENYRKKLLLWKISKILPGSLAPTSEQYRENYPKKILLRNFFEDLTWKPIK